MRIYGQRMNMVRQSCESFSSTETTDIHGSLRQNDFFDVLKFLLAIMIVALHSSLQIRIINLNIAMPWLRIAVPLFFILSAYFLFSKIISRPDDGRFIMRKYIVRNVKLYGIWLVALFPMVIWRRWDSWNCYGLTFVPLMFVRGILFSSTFVASWFISAMVMSTLVVCGLSRYLKTRLLLLITVVIYALVCFRSSYFHFVPEHGVIRVWTGYYEKIFSVGYNSFPAALFWVTCGKFFAENKITVLNYPITLLLGCISVAAVGLSLEWYGVGVWTGSWYNDCYFCLMLLCPLLFCIALRVFVRIPFAKFLRSCSVIMFCSHAVFILFMRMVIKILGLHDGGNVIRFGGSVFLCICFSICVLLFENYFPRWKWLRFAH